MGRPKGDYPVSSRTHGEPTVCRRVGCSARSFEQAASTNEAWDTTATLVTFYARRELPGRVGIDACERAYKAGIREKREDPDIRTLVATGKQFVVGAKEPKNQYTSIEPEF